MYLLAVALLALLLLLGLGVRVARGLPKGRESRGEDACPGSGESRGEFRSWSRTGESGRSVPGLWTAVMVVSAAAAAVRRCAVGSSGLVRAP